MSRLEEYWAMHSEETLAYPAEFYRRRYLETGRQLAEVLDIAEWYLRREERSCATDADLRRLYEIKVDAADREYHACIGTGDAARIAAAESALNSALADLSELARRS